MGNGYFYTNPVDDKPLEYVPLPKGGFKWRAQYTREYDGEGCGWVRADPPEVKALGESVGLRSNSNGEAGQSQEHWEAWEEAKRAVGSATLRALFVAKYKGKFT